MSNLLKFATCIPDVCVSHFSQPVMKYKITSYQAIRGLGGLHKNGSSTGYILVVERLLQFQNIDIVHTSMSVSLTN